MTEFHVEDEDKVQGSGSGPAPPEYAVVPGICCECWGKKPCVVQVPIRDDAVVPRMLRPVCPQCLHRMLQALRVWDRDQATLAQVKLENERMLEKNSGSVGKATEEAGEVKDGKG